LASLPPYLVEVEQIGGERAIALGSRERAFLQERAYARAGTPREIEVDGLVDEPAAVASVFIYINYTHCKCVSQMNALGHLARRVEAVGTLNADAT